MLQHCSMLSLSLPLSLSFSLSLSLISGMCECVCERRIDPSEMSARVFLQL